jgi:predicted HD superfamily hydrolase involved in NAD metabolism
MPGADEFDADDYLPQIESRLEDLPDGLQAHISRSRAVGADLAELHGVDPERVDVALAAHDVYRAAGADALLAQAVRRGWEADPIERAAPILLHGGVAALWLMQEVGMTDQSVIEAVTWHTTFAPSLGPVATLVFLADKIDPDKVERKPWRTEVRDLAHSRSPEDAVELYLSVVVVEEIEGGGLAHSRALDALNYLRLGKAHLH